MFGKKYKANGLAMQLVLTDPTRFESPKVAARYIKNGMIGKMTGRGGSVEQVIRDPNYIPKDGEEFSRYDGMFGSDAWWATNKEVLFIVH